MNPANQGNNDAASAAGDELRIAIERVLAALAELAIDADLSMQEIEEVAKSTFVAAAAKRATRAAGSVNRSRVAAITGLSRPDVTQLLRSPNIRDKRDRRSRAKKIVDAWSEDQSFLDKRGRPRTLPMRGRKGSFEQLVRMYARDVPPKAMLDRLLNLSLVTVLPARGSTSQRVALIRKAPSRKIERNLAALISALTRLIQAQSAGHAYSIATIFLPASSEIEQAIMARAIEERTGVFLSGMRSAFPTAQSNGLGITVLLGSMLDQLPSSSTGIVSKSKYGTK